MFDILQVKLSFLKSYLALFYSIALYCIVLYRLLMFIIVIIIIIIFHLFIHLFLHCIVLSFFYISICIESFILVNRKGCVIIFYSCIMKGLCYYTCMYYVCIQM